MIVVILTFFLLLKIFLTYTNAKCTSKVCLVGKTAVITGGNSGLGRETARALASRGCKIIIADKDDANVTVEALKKETHNPNIISIQVDYASFASVREFAKIINSTEERLDILVNNAGIADVRYKITEDRVQKIMQVNYFSHFLLVHLLADLLKKSEGRILFASSLAIYGLTSLTLKSVSGEKPEDCSLFSSKTYGNSKVCLTIASNMFAKKFIGTGVTSNAYHPGIVKTGIIKAGLDITYGLHYFIMILYFLWSKAFGKSVEEGAQTILHLAMSDEVKNISGKFFVETYQLEPPSKTRDEQFCREIWKASELLVGLKPEEKLL